MSIENNRDSDRHGGGEVETAILEAARDLLAEGGVAGLSMRQVADRVGVTATAIYHYFDGKQAIVNRVVLSAFERFGAYLKAAMAPHPVGSVERLQALGEAYIRFAFENDAYFRVIFSIQPKNKADLTELPDGGGYNLLRDAVAEAVAAGTLRRCFDDDAAEGSQPPSMAEHIDNVSMYLWSLAHGIITLTLSGSSVDERCDLNRQSDTMNMLKAFFPLVTYGIREPCRRSGETNKEESSQSE